MNLSSETIVAIASASLAIISMVITIIISLKDRGRNDYITVDKAYKDILLQGVENPKLRDPLLTCKYDMKINGQIDRDYFLRYDSYAYIVWNFLETIFDFSETTKKKKKDRFVEIWYPALIQENKLHYHWFKNNQIRFEKKFREFVNHKLNDIEIVEGSDEDFQLVYNLMPTEFPREEMKGKEQLIRILMSGKYHLYLAKLKERIDGDDSFVGYALGYLDEKKNAFFLDYIHILKEYQNCGYGTQFLKKIQENIVTGPEPMGIYFEIEQPNDGKEGKKTKRFNFYTRLGGHRIDVDYYLPTQNGGKIPLDLMFFPKENVEKIGKANIQKFISHAISTIHSDYKHTEKVLNSYLKKIPDYKTDSVLDIFKGSISDLDDVCSFLERSFENKFKISREAFAERMKSGKYELVIARKSKNLIGFAFIYLPKDHKFAYLDYFLINPFARNRGYGSMFMNEIKKRIFNMSKYGLFSEIERESDNYIFDFIKNHGGQIIEATYTYPSIHENESVSMRPIAFLKPDIKELDSRTIRSIYREVLIELHGDVVNKSNFNQYFKKSIIKS